MISVTTRKYVKFHGSQSVALVGHRLSLSPIVLIVFFSSVPDIFVKWFSSEARITTAAPPTTTTFVQSGTRTEKIESGEESSSSKNAQFVFFFVFVKMF